MQKKSLESEPLDATLDPVVPLVEQDQYTGTSPLRYSNASQPIDPNILAFPRKGMVPYNEVTYAEAYKPPDSMPDPAEEFEQDKTPSVPPPSGPSPPPVDGPDKHSPDPVPNIDPSMPLTSTPAITPPRRSKRLTTAWGPSTIAKVLFTVLLGVTFLPNTIIAEPINGLKDTGVAHLHPDPIFMKPLSKEERHENLRAYHARLDLMNEVMDPDPTNRDWQAQSIESFVVRGEGENTRILLKVAWFGGDKQWVQMDDMRLHDPFMVLRYGAICDFPRENEKTKS